MELKSPDAGPGSLGTVSGKSSINSTLQKVLRHLSCTTGRANPDSVSPTGGLSYLVTGKGDVLLLDNPAEIDLEPEPIPPEWILSGAPEASAKLLLRGRDWLQSIVVWECTPGRFNWHYNKDEILFIVFGHATLTSYGGEEREFGPGDTVFFPAGVSCTWQIKDRVRKVAILRETLWWPLGMTVKVWLKLLRTVGLGGKSPL